MLDLQNLPNFHDACLERWQSIPPTLEAEGFYKLIQADHADNYQLWLAEDRARRDDKGYEFVYHAKREIDRWNQARNDQVEAMDLWLFEHLSPPPIGTCPVNSETPAMIIDRLSIMSLKIFHMALQAKRSEASEAHRETCRHKLGILRTQRIMLHECLLTLINDIKGGKRTFGMFRQFKMYNDPNLNPQLYAGKGEEGA
ncbi:MAG: hypothetical protein A3F18_07665 [Legionellales bacterium RIFCSPHIGHO2_12_FULL_37_14]|nr:MAG: hypothetical protein A3F18_07665 [Legionellales bacterium RIFCSPHIGHO2_12_FULL_37_14]